MVPSIERASFSEFVLKLRQWSTPSPSIHTPQRAIIKINITSLTQMFNSYDPSPFFERDIDNDAEDYLITYAEELLLRKKEDGFRIEVYITDCAIKHHQPSSTTNTTPEDALAIEKKTQDLNSEEIITTQKPLKTEIIVDVEPTYLHPASYPRTSHLQPAPATINPTITTFPAPLVRSSSSSNSGTFHPIVLPPADSKNTITKKRIYMEDVSKDLEKCIRNHFTYRVTRLKNEIQHAFRIGRTSLIVGITVLIICATISRVLLDYDRNIWLDIISSILNIFGWVSLWKPIEIIVYSWWPSVEKLSMLKKLADSEVWAFNEIKEG